MKPFFTVIIPLYNKQNFIENTIKSVLNQNFTDFELLIIDDCSTDSSLEIVSKFKNEKIKIIKHDINKGLSATRNTGIKNSNSEYLAFIDADDLWKNTFLDEIFILINNYPEAKLFATNYEEIYSNSHRLIPKNNSTKLNRNSIVFDFFEINLAQPLYNASSICVEKSVFNQIGYYDEKITFGEDVDFNIRANAVFKLAYSNLPLSEFLTLSENQITQSKLSNKVITDFDFYDNESCTKSLKKFLDFNRYIMAKHYKMENDYHNFYKMKKGINIKNLTLLQFILLNLPKEILMKIKIIKHFFLNRGFRFTSYK